jgi:hypothetical protein
MVAPQDRSGACRAAIFASSRGTTNRGGTELSCPRRASGPHGPFPPLQGSEALLYAARREPGFALFLGSSAVEHSTVNRMVAGSNPARGANQIKRLAQKFCFRPWRHVCTVSANPAAPALTVLTNSKPSSLTLRRLSLGPRAFTRCRDNQGWRGQQASARETQGRSPRFAR